MDVLAKSTILIVENYAIRKNQGVARQGNLSFKNFMQNARLICNFDGQGMNNHDLLIVLRHFLNSVLLRSGMQIISGGLWDMTGNFINGYSSMECTFDAIWEKKYSGSVTDYLYKFVNGAVATAGVAIATSTSRNEVIPNGIRISRAAAAERTRIEFSGIRALATLREVGVYFVINADGDTALNTQKYILRQASLGNSLWRYRSHGGVNVDVVNGVQFEISGGTMESLANAEGVWDLEVYIRSVNDHDVGLNVEKIDYSGKVSFLSTVPEINRLPSVISEIMDTFYGEFITAGNIEATSINLGQELSECFAYVINCIASQFEM